jgi:hypothetical protein
MFIAETMYAHRLDRINRQIESCEMEDGKPNYNWRRIPSKEMEITPSDKDRLRVVLEELIRVFPANRMLPNSARAVIRDDE